MQLRTPKNHVDDVEHIILFKPTIVVFSGTHVLKIGAQGKESDTSEARHNGQGWLAP